MTKLNYFCKRCRHAWFLLMGCYTPQKSIPKAHRENRDAYVEVVEDEHGNVLKTRYTREAGHCYCGTAFPVEIEGPKGLSMLGVKV